MFNPGIPESVLNKAPTAFNGTLNVPLNTTTSGNLLAEDENANDTLTYSILSLPSKGTVTVTNQKTGAYTYTPNHLEIGADSFTFKVSDSRLDSNTATITVIIFDPNTPPVAKNITPASFNEDDEKIIILDYSDADSDVATSCAITNSAHLIITQSCVCDTEGTCSVGIKGASNYSGPASLNYTVTANSQTSNIAIVNLSMTPVNDPPTFSSIPDKVTNEDTPIEVSFIINDVDSSISCASSISMNSTNTALVPNASVVWTGTTPNCTGTITPGADLYGITDITFTASDGSLATSETFSLTVTRLADDPISFDWLFNFSGWVNGITGYSVSNPDFITIGTSPSNLGEEVAYLIPADQTDDDNNATKGFGGGTSVGLNFETLLDGTSLGLRLGENSNCDGRSSDCAKQSAPEIYELSSSWTPKWANIVGYWKLNGDLLDSSGNLNHGTAVSPTYSYDSKLGSGALASIQNDSLSESATVADSPTLRISHTMSASFWIKATPTPEIWSTILQKSSNAAWGWSISGAFTSGKIRFNTGTSVAGNQYHDSNKVVMDNTYHHVVCIFNNGEKYIYIDGVLDKVGTYQHGDGLGYNRNLTIGSLTTTGEFSGTIDEIAIWNTVLSSEEVRSIYERQASHFSGSFISRIMDARAPSSWTHLNWLPTLPYFKELPDATCSPIPCAHNNPETNHSFLGYSSIVGSDGTTVTNDLMTGIIGLWHFNESSWADIPSEVKDDSGLGHHGQAKLGATTISGGKFNKSASFDGINQYILIPHSSTQNFGTGAMTLSSWVKLAPGTLMSSSGHEYCVISKGLDANAKYQLCLRGGNGSYNGFYLRGGPGNVVNVDTRPSINQSSVFLDYKWHHIVATRDFSSSCKIYLDGNLVGIRNADCDFNGDSTEPLVIGRISLGSYFKGSIDEVSIWSRALDGNEIKQLYQRGASRLKFQFRTCNNPDCSDESWQGPDGTSGTFFSELDNRSTDAGLVKSSPPGIDFSVFSLAISNKRYFQYRTIFETDSTDSNLGPELKSVTAGPAHYSTEEFIIGNQGVDFYNTNSFTEVLGTGGCAGGVVYNLSTDKINWKYWGGESWLNSNGTSSQANSAAEINSILNNDPAKLASDIGPGSVYFKAFLKSTQISKCELNSVQIRGTR